MMRVYGLVALLLAMPAKAAPLPYTGVNLAGGEFYDPVKIHDPVYGQNFTYPTAAELDYFAGKGMNLIRFAFLWETLQPAPKQPFRPVEIERLKAVVKLATGRGLVVLLDPHNYARYFGRVVGGPDVGDDVFADFWARLAREFRDDPKVWFGLVNEPHDMPTEQWLKAANAAIAAIRNAGAGNLILVPGNGWTGAWTWLQNRVPAQRVGGANGDWMLKIQDPRNHYVFEVHQYLDADGSGSHPAVVSPTIGSERLRPFVDWCRAHHQRAFLGEFAAAATPTGQQAIGDMLQSMERDRDVWIGWSWWAAGAWWHDYMFTLEPQDGRDRAQMAWLLPHVHGPPAARVPGETAGAQSEGVEPSDAKT